MSKSQVRPFLSDRVRVRRLALSEVAHLIWTHEQILRMRFRREGSEQPSLLRAPQGVRDHFDGWTSTAIRRICVELNMQFAHLDVYAILKVSQPVSHNQISFINGNKDTHTGIRTHAHTHIHIYTQIYILHKHAAYEHSHVRYSRAFVASPIKTRTRTRELMEDERTCGLCLITSVKSETTVVIFS
ncbi:hypothetical protein EVAR_23325_1 [Eumeta japonica]|uniref:Uncharacterized protein n=1 Tax=Eumeta variegata TaxID=151549 RepID=A0A4C1XZN7_EUMVA|nr:hypothetical protein EVAR_23325_1 [Eumeta japonica]